MKYILMLAAALYFLTANAQTSAVEWIKRIGDSGTDACGAIATDSNGNVYVGGGFVGQLIFNNDTLNSPSITEPTMFLAKYDSLGNAMWGKRLAYTNYTPFPLAIADIKNIRVSQSGRIYALGSLNFGTTSYAYISINRPDGSQVVQYSNFQGAVHVDIDFDSLDNAYVAGHYPGTSYIPYIAKLDSTGDAKWSFLMSSQDCRVMNVRYLNGVMYIAGQFRYQCTLADTSGSSPITLNATNGINDFDFFIAQYSIDGKLLAAHKEDGLVGGIGGPFECSSDFTKSAKWNVTWVNPSGVMLFKQYDSTLTVLNNFALPITSPCPFTPGAYTKCTRFNEESVFSYSGLICPPVKNFILDGNGTIQDTVRNPTTGTIMSYTPVRELTLGSSGNLYILSEFTGTLGYADGTGSKSLPSVAGSQDVYVAKFHKCATYSPQITQNGNILVCSLPGMTYQWYLDGNPISGSGQTIIPAEDGNYSVTVTDVWGCKGYSNSLYAVSIDAIVKHDGIKVFPNPVSSLLTIDNIEDNTEIIITDVIGKILISGVQSHRATIDVSSFAKGVYVLKINGKSIRIVKK